MTGGPEQARRGAAGPEQAPRGAAGTTPPERCQRTAGLVDRVVRDAVTQDDREHALHCATCGPVLHRAARFDDDLRHAARGLVAEDLPRGVFDPGLSGAPRAMPRRTSPGMAGIFAAAAMLLVAMSVALLPGGRDDPSGPPPGTAGATPGPVATPADTGMQLQGPSLRPTVRIGGSLIGSDWTCSSGRAIASPATGFTMVQREGIVCVSPPSQLLTRVVLVTGESVDGEVVEVTISGELAVVDTAGSRSEMAESLSKAVYLSIGDETRAPAIADWVLGIVPELKASLEPDSRIGVFDDVRLALQRSPDGMYSLTIHALPGG